ncbi:MAG TPA: hypothetical protein DEA96_06030 [Leptospiraceae bacterium]|nr:hypothetical protein [Spirochaetaceae bacterium]HBS04502.1 hypothetical protein [Leptospiraceae bacterium]|tara:strand:+ start:91965 stop:92663 length:699 start_codon:yes stop_codon:yes gene_type:complete
MDKGNGLETLSDVFSIEKVEWYLRFLEENNERGGFFSRGDAARIFDRHVRESAMFVERVQNYVPVSRETTALDAGSGPGLPGFLLACLKEPPRLTLNDSSRRRLSLLEEALATTDQAFPSVRFSYDRLEEFKGSFDLIMSRALIPFPSVLRLISHLQKPGAIYAGFFSPMDIAQFAQVVADCGYRLHGQDSFLTSNEVQREIFYFQKEKVVRQGKPFAWKFIRGEMSQWQKS